MGKSVGAQPFREPTIRSGRDRKVDGRALAADSRQTSLYTSDTLSILSRAVSRWTMLLTTFAVLVTFTCGGERTSYGVSSLFSASLQNTYVE